MFQNPKIIFLKKKYMSKIKKIFIMKSQKKISLTQRRGFLTTYEKQTHNLKQYIKKEIHIAHYNKNLNVENKEY